MRHSHPARLLVLPFLLHLIPLFTAPLPASERSDSQASSRSAAATAYLFGNTPDLGFTKPFIAASQQSTPLHSSSFQRVRVRVSFGFVGTLKCEPGCTPDESSEPRLRQETAAAGKSRPRGSMSAHRLASVRAKPTSTLRLDADRVGTMQIDSRAPQKGGPEEARGRKEAMHSRNMQSTPIPQQTNCAELVPP